jgi:hypothetical protein
MVSITSGKSVRGAAVHILNCLLLAGLMTGCAFTRTPVKVAFGPVAGNPLKAGTKTALEIGTISDARQVTDGMVLYQKMNAYGTTSGAYVTEKPVTEVFKDGLTAALQQNGFMNPNPAKYQLTAEIKGGTIGVIQNMWSANTAKAWMQVRFELVDKATGLPVWHDTYDGEDSRPVPTWEDSDFIAQEFSRTASDIFRQLVSDKAFRNYFE